MSTYIAVLAMVIAYVALVAAYFALRTLAKLRRATAALDRGAGSRRESLVEASERQGHAVALLHEQLADLRLAVDDARAYVDDKCAETITSLKADAGNEVGALRHIALVRYDAFSEMSGRMSFSLALLDDSGDGIAISAISANADTRVYAKGVSGGQGEHELSPEEQQAVVSAMQRQRGRFLQRKAS